MILPENVYSVFSFCYHFFDLSVSRRWGEEESSYKQNRKIKVAQCCCSEEVTAHPQKERVNGPAPSNK